MAWLNRSTKKSVTVASLLERQVSLKWHESVAIVLEAADVFERSGKRAIARPENVAIIPSGTVEFRRGRTQSGGPVTALARMLSALLPRDRPTQLRLLVSTAGPDSAAYKSVKEFTEALGYFERPGRRNILSEVYQRALDAPMARADETVNETLAMKGRKRKSQRRRRWMPLPVAAVLVLAVVVVGAIVLLEGRTPGLLNAQTAPLQSLGSDTWNKALEATADFRESASRDLSTVLERVREAADEVTGDADAETEGSDTEAPVSTQSRLATPKPASGASDAELETPGPDAETVSEAEGLTAESQVVSVEFVEFVEAAAVDDPLDPSEGALFDSGDVNVTPPVTLRLRVPVVPDNAPWDEDVGVVEAIVSAAGEVEKVRLVAPPESIHEAMILSAIKTWRFHPATRDGHAVRYRQLIPVAVPR